jgi:Leucine-rich repeat (LRR) protein
MFKLVAVTTLSVLFSFAVQANSGWINKCDQNKDRNTADGRLLAVLFDDFGAESCDELYDYLSTERELDLSDYNLKNFWMLTEFKNITDLHIALNPVYDISFLKQMPNIEVLDLSECQYLHNADALSSLRKLKEVTFELGGLRKAPSFHP